MELYQETENMKKSKLPMIIGICLAILIVIIIAIIVAIVYLNGSVMKITINGQKNNNIFYKMKNAENLISKVSGAPAK